VTPEGRDYLDKAAEDLGDARKILAINLARPAARSAYYAAFHAAEAMIFERTGKVAKTHSGVRSVLASLLARDAADTRVLLTFLARAYKFKEIGDYGLGDAAMVTEDEARDLIEGAAQFIGAVKRLIATP
jgi:uncharacterized protein (UPF0332 family)